MFLVGLVSKMEHGFSVEGPAEDVAGKLAAFYGENGAAYPDDEWRRLDRSLSGNVHSVFSVHDFCENVRAGMVRRVSVESHPGLHLVALVISYSERSDVSVVYNLEDCADASGGCHLLKARLSKSPELLTSEVAEELGLKVVEDVGVSASV